MVILVYTFFILFSIIVFCFVFEIICRLLSKLQFLKNEEDFIFKNTLLAKKLRIPESYQNDPWIFDYVREAKHVFANIRWKSYTYWTSKFYTGEYINIDKNGRRKTWNAKTNNHSKKVIIFVFGGSTIWGWGSRDEHTIPSYLAKQLNELGLIAEVMNMGENGYVNTQEMIDFIITLRDKQVPNIAIFYDGINDAFTTYQLQRAGLPQNEFNRIAEFQMNPIKKALQYTWKKSASKMLLNSIFKTKNESPIVLLNKDKILAELCVTNYFSNIHIIETLCTSNNILPFFYWQPALFTKLNKTKYEEEIEEPHKFWKDFYFLVNQELDHRQNKPKYFFNISDIFSNVSKAIYIDPWHVSEIGNNLIATRIVKDISSSLLLENYKPEIVI